MSEPDNSPSPSPDPELWRPPLCYNPECSRYRRPMRRAVGAGCWICAGFVGRRRVRGESSAPGCTTAVRTINPGESEKRLAGP